MLANIPLAKAVHMAKHRVSVGGDFTNAQVQSGVVHWGSLLSQLPQVPRAEQDIINSSALWKEQGEVSDTEVKS